MTTANITRSKFIAIRSLTNLFAGYARLVELAEKHGLAAAFDAEVLYSRSINNKPSLKNLLDTLRIEANIIKTSHETLLQYPQEIVALEPYSSISAAVAEGQRIHPDKTVTAFMGELTGPLKHYYNAHYPEDGMAPSMSPEVSQMLAQIKQLCEQYGLNTRNLISLSDCSIAYDFDSKTLRINDVRMKFKGKYKPALLATFFNSEAGKIFSYDDLLEQLGIRAGSRNAPEDPKRVIRDAIHPINERVMEEVPTADELILLQDSTFHTPYAPDTDED
jgi:hypothetical protein